jgi:hypothetical protein
MGMGARALGCWLLLGADCDSGSRRLHASIHGYGFAALYRLSIAFNIQLHCGAPSCASLFSHISKCAPRTSRSSVLFG